MKKVKLILTVVLVTGMVAMFLEGCKKSETAIAPLKLVSVTTDTGVALDGATAATSIATNSKVVATFDKDIDAASANSSSIALIAGGVDVGSSVAVSGAVVTLTPNVLLATGTNYTVSVAANLKAKDGGPATPSELTFKTFGRADVVPPQLSNQLSHFPFTGNLNDAGGTHTPVAADVRFITFVADRFGFAGLAGDFNGSTSIAEIPNAEQYMAHKDITVSFWVKASSTNADASPKNAHFVLGLAGWYGFHFEIQGQTWTDLNKAVQLTARYDVGAGLSESEDNWWNGQPNTWQGSLFAKDVSAAGGVGFVFKDKWTHVVHTYNSTTKVGTLYVNGEKVRQWDFNLWPAGAKQGTLGVKFAGNLTGGGNKLAFGFIQGSQNRFITDGWADPADLGSNHLRGQLDDVRIFKVALSTSEVATLYAAEKP